MCFGLSKLVVEMMVFGVKGLGGYDSGRESRLMRFFVIES